MNKTTVLSTPLTSRRRTLQSAGSLAAGALLATVPGLGNARITADSPSAPLPATPAGPVGPFYPQAFSASPTASLLPPGAASQATVLLSGRLTDPAGRPLTAVRIEIWQCDSFGRYHHSRDSDPEDRDPGFLGFGWQTTDAQGHYRFTTIVPPPYPGRTPHIHLAIISNTTSAVTQTFATQIYLPAEQQRNRADSLYRSLGDKAGLSTATRQADQLRFDLVMRHQG
ncbi:MAG: hypothetical protein ACRBC3_14355 [Burkholderiaceae bacterium]